MTIRIFLLQLCTILCLYSGFGFSQSLVTINLDSVIICPITSSSNVIPSFSERECKTTNAWKIDPQNTALWVKTTVNVPEYMLKDKNPHSVYISGKAASKVYFNGQYLGSNGSPNVIPNLEQVGKIDAMFYVPANLIKPKINEIIIKMSSHHGFLTLSNPLNFIGFGIYSDPTYFIHRNLGVSIVPLGALLLGAIYFLVASFSPRNRPNNLLFLLMTSFASLQLFAEISRSLFSYPYPFQDVRLLLIVSLSLLFGLCFLTFIILKLEKNKPYLWVFAGGSFSLLTVLLTPGFDPKTALAIFVPSAISATLLTTQAVKTKSKEWAIYAAVFVLFSVTIVLTLTTFHDVLFYYIITGVLILLFVLQAQKLNQEQKDKEAEQALVAKLQFKLEQNQQQTEPSTIKINSAGKIEIIASNQVVFCKAAGDYVEINLKDHQQRLFTGSLKELESSLPKTFLRVHRSYLVNVEFINSLNTKSSHQTETSGAGFLQLHDAVEVPVSRRIMPTVRNYIKQS
ncbi:MULTISPECIES: LytTR family DNA-binding domain-containing protein [unclassified Colwellia]|uniref:LytR/AlgR family response regulator transcription factor n=1 Tax=unclassified Colwellia TaxID=196834 RepID=UPI0015F374DE|nr:MULTISPECIES: LytTR family DNA-binding domain-containing protein [unclassified Colwellia]MBA6355041.1 LytTR family transcriptional regulator [Colwellia sp. BRX8-3]MBA6366943.1 LytTR family transcriptional regulator [Colwellia sp. BRX8-5]MBA6374119.1 LytTR family transcriptional regulator [Colwellia sp. BRX8-2]